MDSIDELEALRAKVKDKVEVIFPIKDLAYGAREFAIRDLDCYGLLFGAILPKTQLLTRLWLVRADHEA